MSIGQASASNPIVPLSIEGHIKVGEPLQVPRSLLHVKELNSRIGKALAAFRELDKVWRDRNINLDTSWNFTMTVSFPHSCMHASAGHSLSVMRSDLTPLTCMRCQRKILLVLWSQHITNSSIRFRNKRPQLTAVIRKRCLQCFGHLHRMNMDRIPNKLYHWKPSHGKIRPGERSKKKKKKKKRHQQNDLGWNVEEAEFATRERIMWRHLSSQAVSAVMHRCCPVSKFRSIILLDFFQTRY